MRLPPAEQIGICSGGQRFDAPGPGEPVVSTRDGGGNLPRRLAVRICQEIDRPTDELRELGPAEPEGFVELLGVERRQHVVVDGVKADRDAGHGC